MCEVIVPDPETTGDTLYGSRSCDQGFWDFVQPAYEIDKGDWDNGWGWEAPCDTNLPLARTLNGLWCLEYSADDPLNESDEMPTINWAGRFARSNIDELDARCGTDDGPFAKTVRGIDDFTELFQPFFYQEPPSGRAGTLFHEARHANGKSHDDGGKDSSWDFKGAWRYQVTYLADFVRLCHNTTQFNKDWAVGRANQILSSSFTRDPGFRINPEGFSVPKDKETKESKDKEKEKEGKDGGPKQESEKQTDDASLMSFPTRPPDVGFTDVRDSSGMGIRGPFIRPGERPVVGP